MRPPAKRRRFVRLLWIPFPSGPDRDSFVVNPPMPCWGSPSVSGRVPELPRWNSLGRCCQGYFFRLLALSLKTSEGRLQFFGCPCKQKVPFGNMQPEWLSIHVARALVGSTLGKNRRRRSLSNTAFSAGKQKPFWATASENHSCILRNVGFSNWVWLKIKQEGQTAGFGPCFHLPGQPILEYRFFEHSQLEDVFQTGHGLPEASKSRWRQKAKRKLSALGAIRLDQGDTGPLGAGPDGRLGPPPGSGQPF